MLKNYINLMTFIYPDLYVYLEKIVFLIIQYLLFRFNSLFPFNVLDIGNWHYYQCTHYWWNYYQIPYYLHISTQ